MVGEISLFRPLDDILKHNVLDVYVYIFIDLWFAKQNYEIYFPYDII